MLEESKTPRRASSQAEPKLLFRADTDQTGDWYVWRRLGVNGWATMRRCDGRDEAQQLAETMNKETGDTVFGG